MACVIGAKKACGSICEPYVRLHSNLTFLVFFSQNNPIYKPNLIQFEEGQLVELTRNDPINSFVGKCVSYKV